MNNRTVRDSQLIALAKKKLMRDENLTEPQAYKKIHSAATNNRKRMVEIAKTILQGEKV